MLFIRKQEYEHKALIMLRAENGKAVENDERSKSGLAPGLILL
jgi:hypothetical protein